jgi:UDP-N-acetylmuramate dehydrogenase
MQIMSAPVIERAPLAPLTTFKVGGSARALVSPRNVQELAAVIAAGDIKTVIGGGSNLLIADAGIDGTVVRIAKPFATVNMVDAGDQLIIDAEAGVPLTKLASIALKHSATGLEFAYGIPGTVGGAIVMNAGAHSGQMKEVVESVDLITAGGVLETWTADTCGFTYRSSSLPVGAVVASVKLRLKKGETPSIQSTMRENYRLRRSSQPLTLPSAGSVFKNPAGDYAGRLIEECGMKGVRIGKGAVSDKHANFIVNLGGATASEIYALIRKIEEAVADRFGIMLEREIKLLGMFGDEE